MKMFSNKTWDYLIMLTASFCVLILSTDYNFSHIASAITETSAYVAILLGL